MSLISTDEFETIFSPLKNRKVGFFPFQGNVEYQLINSATEQLLYDYQVNYRVIKQQEIIRGECYQPLDVLLISGGDYLNNTNPETEKYLQDALVLGVPVTVLPQSIYSSAVDLSPYEKVFIREKNSLKHAKEAGFAPELALALRPPWVDEGAEEKTGVWLREDNERCVEDPGLSLGDPVHISWNKNDYFGLASKFEHIVTDRLHFAIAGLLTNRRVTLLPNANGINRTIYESWLKDLGCRWRNSLTGIKTSRDEIIDRLWKRLSSPPSSLVGWNTLPCRDDDWELIPTGDSAILRSADKIEITLNPTAMLVWSICEGEESVEEICSALAEHYQQPLLDVAGDVQRILCDFKKQGVIKKDGIPGHSVKQQSLPAIYNHKFIDVEITPPRKKNGRMRWLAHVRGTSLGDFIHYFDFDPRWRGALTKRADPFVLALLPRAMKDGASLRITGAPVDAQLLDHLDEFQRIWQVWEPADIQPVTIIAEETVGVSPYSRPALTAFSGGLDSTHTITRHCIVPDGRRNRTIEAAIMACGFDIPVNDRNGFSAAIKRLRPVTEDAGIDLIGVYTNIRSHIPSWVLGHGVALASVLCLFSGRFGTGLIPSTFTYQHLNRWGSNPISDHLLGGAFTIEHDSAGVSRFDKLCAVAQWPTGRQRLRVCWRNRNSAKNCGHCEKCYHLAIGLQALSIALDCFDEAPDASLLANYAKRVSRSGIENSDFSRILEYAIKIGLREPWVEVLRKKQA